MSSYRYLFLLPVFLFLGCSDSLRPSDLPPLFPCTITVTQGGVPLSGAFVALVSLEPQKYRPTAVTDADGNAVMLTYGHPGAPAGRYKIVVRKTIEDNIVMGINEYGEQAVISSNRFETVYARYSNAETTPHEIEVTTRGRTRITIDVGEPVRVGMHTSN